jgi:N-acetylglucosamine-6-phosphate deacetylase
MLLRAAHFESGERRDWVIESGRIQAIQAPGPVRPDVESEFVAPAFFDLQINGGGGRAFGSPSLSIEDIHHIVALCRSHGIGSLCPTLITGNFSTLELGFTVLHRACDTDAALARAMPRFHLEGPYISSEDGPRGAHPRAHVRPPDWDEFQRWQEAAGGRIGLVTLAPEQSGALPFIERLVKSGVVVALGHTAAAPAQIRNAISAGARLSTHLGNGCHLMLHRHHNPLWEEMAADELWASIICDGHHLPPALVRTIVRAKTAERLVLTCDASSLAGMPPGRYREWDQDLEVLPEGKIIVPDQGVLAGSWAFTDACIGKAMRFGGLILPQAVALATVQPRRLLGLSVPTLEVGQPADLVLFAMDQTGELQVRRTVVNGE